MRDLTSICQVCDGDAVWDSPIPLCERCLREAHAFVRDNRADIRTGDNEHISGQRCPYCDHMTLIRNLVTNECECSRGMGGCGGDVPVLHEVRVKILVERERAAQQAKALVAEHRLVADIEVAAGLSQVYYIRVGDQVKIGVSSDPLRRARALSLPAATIVATEPGTYVTEHHRHEQFAHLRMYGEWFKAEADLLAHIAALQAAA